MKITPEKIISHLSLMDKSALILLSEADDEPIHGKTSYEKELFFIADNDENIKYVADFEPYLFGPHSEPAENSLTILKSYGLVKEYDGYYSLTELGKEISLKIKENPQGIDVDDIRDVKELLNDMSLDEIILFTYVLHPEYTDESKIKEKILKKRIPLSISLYKRGKIGLEMSAKLAGISIEDFLDKMRVK